MEKNSLGHVIVKAWQDPNFKEKLIKDPRQTLIKEGVAIPAGVKVIVCENTDSQVFLVIPQKPSEELSEEQLLTIAGGAFTGVGGSYEDPVMKSFDADRDARIAARYGG